MAYLAGSYEGLIINIFDGEQMLFPIDALHVVDADIAEYGNGIGRFTAIWAAAKGGGAFICYTGGGLTGAAGLRVAAGGRGVRGSGGGGAGESVCHRHG